jgi:hypothetical protein
MNANTLGYVEHLEEHISTADNYIESLQEKWFKWPKDRKAIKYWKAYKAGIQRAIYLAEIHLEEEEEC